MKKGIIEVLVCLNIISPASSVIRCPKGIRRFGAYPDTNISDPAYFYDCSRTSYAVLTRCDSNEIYDTETESCIFYNSMSMNNNGQRFRRSPTNKWVGGLKETQLEPTVGRHVKLGSLYLGTNEEIQFDENLWSDANIEENATKIEAKSSKTNIKITQTRNDRINMFGVSLKLSVSVLFGLVPAFDKSASYLHERKKKAKSVSVTLSYESIKSVEFINQEMRTSLDFPNICRNINGKDNDGPTHVVTSIVRGFRAFLEIEQATKTNSCNIEHANTLFEQINKVKDLTPTSESETHDEGNVLPKRTKFTYSGDKDLIPSPKTFKEAINAYNTLGVIAKTSNKIIYYGLSPIDKYCGDITTPILQALALSHVQRLKDITDEMEEIEVKAKGLIALSPAVKYCHTLGQNLQTFIDKLNQFEIRWKKEVQTAIPQVRSGKATETKLILIIGKYDDPHNPFGQESVNLFLQHRQRELDTVESVIHVKSKGIVIEEDDGGNGNKCLFKYPYAIQYVLNVLPSSNITEEFIQRVNHSGIDKYNEDQSWFWKEYLISLAGAKLRSFLQLFETFDKKKPRCFMVSLKKVGVEKSAATIALYKNGGLIHRNFIPPVKVPPPLSVTVSHNEITFIISYDKTDNVTNLIKVHYIETLNQSKIEILENIRIFQIPDKKVNHTFTIGGLNSNTTYQLTVSAGSEFGYGPSSDAFFVRTNEFTAPTYFKVVNKTDTTLTLSWQAPKYGWEMAMTNLENGTMLYYKIIVYSKWNQKTGDIQMEVVVNGTNTTTLVKNLVSAEEYHVTIEAMSSRNVGSSYPNIVRKGTLESINATTRPATPEAPLIEQISQTHASIEWEKPSKVQGSDGYDGSDISYTLRYTLMDPKDDQATMKEIIIPLKQNQIILKELTEGSIYKISVKVKTSFGESAYSPPAIAETLVSEESYLDTLRKSLGINDVQDTIKSKQLIF